MLPFRNRSAVHRILVRVQRYHADTPGTSPASASTTGVTMRHRPDQWRH